MLTPSQLIIIASAMLVSAGGVCLIANSGVNRINKFIRPTFLYAIMGILPGMSAVITRYLIIAEPFVTNSQALFRFVIIVIILLAFVFGIYFFLKKTISSGHFKNQMQRVMPLVCGFLHAAKLVSIENNSIKI